MENQFGKIKINRLSKAWTEATVIWPGDLKVHGEDESLIINYIIIWKHMRTLDSGRDPIIWSHISNNLDKIIKAMFKLFSPYNYDVKKSFFRFFRPYNM